MGEEYVKTSIKATNWLKNIVIPEIKKHFFKNGYFYILENNKESDFNEVIDMCCGVDLYFKHNADYVVGVASRIQKYKRNKKGELIKYKTFTIRNKRETGAKTEYEKRVEAIAFEYIYPKYTLQAYLREDKDVLERFAIARTKDILEYIKEHKAGTNHTSPDQKGQAEFYVVDWLDMKKHKYQIFIKDYESPCN